jgi:peptidoglycan/xylan/chitin deacetylase (PgdA/CDA1 family)
MLLLTSITGCQSLGGPSTAHAPKKATTALVATEPTETLDRMQLTGFEAPAATTTAAIESPAPAPPVVCTADADKKGYYGMYSTDAVEKGNVVLTFDDGPHPTATPRVLDLLAEHHMPATFFLIGRVISRTTYPLVQRMVAEGHTIGSHSYSHDVKMTRVSAPAQTVEEIRGQHEVTSILIDIALMAQSGDDFDSMFREVFKSDPAVWLEAHTIRKEWRNYLGRHRDLLTERGYKDGARPYAVLYSRPPGGGPYVDHDGAAGIALYDEALTKLGMVNVLWHGASGDTDPEHRGEFQFLTENMDRYAKKGGVILIHDYIRTDALAQGLSKMADDASIHVIPMQEALERKYGCDTESLGVKLAGTAHNEILSRGAIAKAPPTKPSKPVALLGGH